MKKTNEKNKGKKTRAFEEPPAWLYVGTQGIERMPSWEPDANRVQILYCTCMYNTQESFCPFPFDFWGGILGDFLG